MSDKTRIISTIDALKDDSVSVGVKVTNQALVDINSFGSTATFTNLDTGEETTVEGMELEGGLGTAYMIPPGLVELETQYSVDLGQGHTISVYVTKNRLDHIVSNIDMIAVLDAIETAVTEAEDRAQQAVDGATEAAEAASSIATDAQAAINAIVAKGEETLASIPQDYTTLSNDVTDLKSDLDNLETIPYAVKIAMDNLFAKAAYADDDALDDYSVFHTWANTIAITSISAVYTQSGTVYDIDSLDVLQADLVVTASYDNGTSVVVSGYTLSGELTTGTSTITVTYQGKTATFFVTVSQYVVTHTYENNQYIGISNPSNMVLTIGKVVGGGKYSENGRVDPMGSPVSGRAADTSRVLVGNFGGKTFGLSSYTLTSGASVAYACWFGILTNGTWDGTKYVSNSNNYIASAWLTSDVTLPNSNNTNVLVVAFRKGNGSIGDFTAEELAEIPTLIQIS